MSKRKRNLFGIFTVLFLVSIFSFASANYSRKISVSASGAAVVEAVDATIDASICTSEYIYLTIPANGLAYQDDWTDVNKSVASDPTTIKFNNSRGTSAEPVPYFFKYGVTSYVFDFKWSNALHTVANVGDTVVIGGEFHSVNDSSVTMKINTIVLEYKYDSTTGDYYWSQAAAPVVTTTFDGSAFADAVSVDPGDATSLLSVATDNSSDTVEIDYNGSASSGIFVQDAASSSFGNYRITISVTRSGNTYLYYRTLIVGFGGFVMQNGAAVRISQTSTNGLRFAATLSSAAKTSLEAYATAKSATLTYGMVILPADYVTAGYEVTAANFFGSSRKFTTDTQETGKRLFSNMQCNLENYGGSYVVTGSLINIRTSNISRQFIGRAYAKVGDEYFFAKYYDGKQENNSRSMLYVAQRSIEENQFADTLTSTYVNTFKDYVTASGKSYDVKYTVNHILMGNGAPVTYTFNHTKSFVSDTDNMVVTANSDTAYTQNGDYALVSDASITKTLYINKVNEFNFYYQSTKTIYDIQAFTLPRLDTTNNYDNVYNAAVASNISNAGFTSVIYTANGAVTPNSPSAVAVLKNLISFLNKYGLQTIVALNGPYFSYSDTTGNTQFPDFTDGSGNLVAGFAGFFVWDEPRYGDYDYIGNGTSVNALDVIASLATKFKAVYSGTSAEFFVNLFPSYADSSVYSGAGSYEAYMQAYCTTVLSKLDNANKIVSVDTYPIKTDKTLNQNFLYDLLLTRYYATQYNAVARVGLQSSGWNEGNSTQDRQPLQSEMEMQAYAALAFGIDDYFWFTYAQVASLNQTSSNVPVSTSNTVNASYSYIQAVNSEIEYFGSVLKAYTYQGSKIFSKSNYSWRNPQLTAINKVVNSGKYTAVATDAFSEITASQNMLLGSYLNGTQKGYVLVNYTALKNSASNTVTLKTSADKDFYLYRNGSVSKITVTSAGYNLILAFGEGVFITTEVPTSSDFCLVSYKNEDGSVLYQTNVANGSTLPAYSGSTPVYSDAQYTYTFSSWDKTSGTITSNTDVHAVYTKVLKSYTVTILNATGNTSQTIDYGSKPQAPTLSGYTFKGFTDANGVASDGTVRGTTTLIAKWYKLIGVTSAKSVAVTADNIRAGVSTNANIYADNIVPATWYYDVDYIKSGATTGLFNNAAQIYVPEGKAGSYYAVLPKLDFNLYTRVDIGLYYGGGLTALSVEGNDVKGLTNAGVNLLLEISGGNLIVRNVNEATVLATFALSGDVICGLQGLRINFTNDGTWNAVYATEFHGILGYQKYDYTTCELTESSTYDDLVSYLSNNKYYTEYERTNTTESNFLSGLIEQYSGKRAVWTPTASNIGDIVTSDNMDGSSHASAGYVWVKDKDNFQFLYANIYNFGANYTQYTNRNITLKLPALNYSIYSNAIFGVWVQNTNGAFQSFAINGNVAPMGTVVSSIYIVYVNGVNNTFTVCRNCESTVIASGVFTDNVYYGIEGLTLTIVSDGWTQVQVSEIYASLHSSNPAVTVNFNDYDGTQLQTVASHYNDYVKYGASLYTGTTPVRSAANHLIYTFSGWSESVSGSVITYTAQYTSVYETFTVSIINTTDGITNTTVSYGSCVEAVARDGFIFDGYTLNGSDYDITTTVSSNLTLVAKWKLYERSAVTPTANVVIITTLIDKVSGGSYESANKQIVLNGSANYSYTLTFPATDYRTYSEAHCYTAFGGANASYSASAYGTTFTDVITTWNMINIVYSDGTYKIKNNTVTLSEGYHLGYGSTNMGAEWYTYVRLPDNVANGTVGLAFTITTLGNWDWVKFHNGNVNVSGNLIGTTAYSIAYTAPLAKETAFYQAAVDATNGSLAQYHAINAYFAFCDRLTPYEKDDATYKAHLLAIGALESAFTSKFEVWTPTSANISDIVTSSNSDGSSYEAVSNKSWLTDKDGNLFKYANIHNFGSNYTQGTNRNITLTLPAIDYSLYSQTIFAVYVLNTNSNFQSFAINGNVAAMSSAGSTVYVVYVGADNTFSVRYNGELAVIATGTLPTNAYNGTEGLTVTIVSNGWTQVQTFEIYATYKTLKAVESVVMSNVVTGMSGNCTLENAQWRIDGRSDNTYTFTLANLAYNSYSRVSGIIVLGGGNTQFAISAYGTDMVTTVNGTWYYLIVETDYTGTYLKIGSTNISDESQYARIKLSDAVANGTSGLSFTVTTGGASYDWLKIRQSGNVETANLIGVIR